MDEHLCKIKLTLGDVEPCPKGACPFWETGGALIDEDCGLGHRGIDLDRPELAAYLLELRQRLEDARDAEERAAARRSLAELVPPELSGR